MRKMELGSYAAAGLLTIGTADTGAGYFCRGGSYCAPKGVWQRPWALPANSITIHPPSQPQ